MSKRRFRSKAEAECIRELAGRGWQQLARNGQNHLLMIWPTSGQKLLVPGKGPEHFFAKVLKAAQEIEAAG